MSMLVNDTKLLAIPTNILVQDTSKFRGRNVVIKELQIKVYIHWSRGKIRSISLILAAYKLSKRLELKQIHTDNSTKKGISITLLVFEDKINDIFKTIILSAYIICRSHTAEGIKEGIIDIIDGGAVFLDR